MSRYEWNERLFQNYNYDGLGTASPAISDALVSWVDTAVLVRCLCWWDIRIAVDEDHTFQPRAPYPYNLDIYVANGSESLPPTGESEDPILTTMMCARPTESFGSIIGTEEIQRRLWVGNSGALPIDVAGERTGRKPPFSFNARARVSLYNDTTSPTGAVNVFSVLFLIRMRFLFRLDF